MWQGMGYSQSIVEESLKQQKFDDCYASYLLLGRRNTDVSIFNSSWLRCGAASFLRIK
jgi:hypothetical protein